MAIFTNPSMEWMTDQLSMGTTIMACEFDGGVVIGAESRITLGEYVTNKVADKLSKITDHIYCCCSGSVADTQSIADIVRYQLNLLKIQLDELPLVHTAASIFRDLSYNFREKMLASFIVAGWDKKCGGQIYSIPIGGMMQRQSVTIGGSGSSYIYGYVDANFKPNMTKKQTVDFVTSSIGLAIHRDDFSGGLIRLGVISEAGVEKSIITKENIPKFYEG